MRRCSCGVSRRRRADRSWRSEDLQDVFNERSGTVIAVALTSQPQRAGFPLTLEFHSKGLPKESRVKISQIRTLAVERMGKVIGRASPEEVAQVIEGLNEIIGS